METQWIHTNPQVHYTPKVVGQNQKQHHRKLLSTMKGVSSSIPYPANW